MEISQKLTDRFWVGNVEYFVDNPFMGNRRISYPFKRVDLILLRLEMGITNGLRYEPIRQESERQPISEEPYENLIRHLGAMDLRVSSTSLDFQRKCRSELFVGLIYSDMRVRRLLDEFEGK